jgi:hypothetical protein
MIILGVNFSKHLVEEYEATRQGDGLYKSCRGSPPFLIWIQNIDRGANSRRSAHTGKASMPVSVEHHSTDFLEVWQHAQRSIALSKAIRSEPVPVHSVDPTNTRALDPSWRLPPGALKLPYTRWVTEFFGNLICNMNAQDAFRELNNKCDIDGRGMLQKQGASLNWLTAEFFQKLLHDGISTAAQAAPMLRSSVMRVVRHVAQEENPNCTRRWRAVCAQTRRRYAFLTWKFFLFILRRHENVLEGLASATPEQQGSRVRSVFSHWIVKDVQSTHTEVAFDIEVKSVTPPPPPP